MKLTVFILLTVLTTFSTKAQNRSSKEVIQFTGVVFAQDSISVIPGVHIYTPISGRGTTSNPYGFFSMPALEGDSIIFSAVGFERVHYIIPKHDQKHSLKLLVYLNEDITFLEEVEVFPYPSEAAFKAALLATTLPNQRDLDNINRWLNSDIMRTMYWNLPASPNMNHRFFMQEQMNAQISKVQPTPNPLLNPFAWATFIRSLQKKKDSR